jgi:hypothetical protein
MKSAKTRALISTSLRARAAAERAAGVPSLWLEAASRARKAAWDDPTKREQTQERMSAAAYAAWADPVKKEQRLLKRMKTYYSNKKGLSQ